MTATASIELSMLEIYDIPEPIICAYFTKMNSGEFSATAALFAQEGYLHPPFEQLIRGPQAIAQYLEKEAQGMRFCPEHIEEVVTDSQGTQYQVQGNVQTSWFTVKVAWLIELNTVQKITSLEVRLIAPLNELLGLSRRDPMSIEET